MYCYLQPIVASMLAVLWGMDRFTPTKGAAILLVFVESTWSTAVNRGPRWKPKRSKPHAVPLRMRLLCPTFRKVPDAPEKRPPRKRLTNNCSNRINISVSARNPDYGNCPVQRKYFCITNNEISRSRFLSRNCEMYRGHGGRSPPLLPDDRYSIAAAAAGPNSRF